MDLGTELVVATLQCGWCVGTHWQAFRGAPGFFCLF